MGGYFAIMARFDRRDAVWNEYKNDPERRARWAKREQRRIEAEARQRARTPKTPIDTRQIVSRDEVLTRVYEKLRRRNKTSVWLTFVDGQIYADNRPIGRDLETLSRELRVLRRTERLEDPPKCSRCRCRVPRIHRYGGYRRQCDRCLEWSRNTRKDRTRCVDCRRVKPPEDNPNLSRCSRCHRQKWLRAIVNGPGPADPPWDRKPRRTFWN